MFAFTTVLALSLSVASVVSAGLVPRRDPPAGWNFAVLEPYQTYHTRYLALGCEFQHGKPFFDECCHPHLNWQQLSSFPAECTPSPAAMSSAAAVEPTSTVTTPADSDDSGVETVTVTSTSGEPGPTTNSDDDNDDEDCDPEDDDGDDDDEPTTTAAPSPTTESHKPSSTPAPAPSSSKETPKPSPAAESPKPSPKPSSSAAPKPSSSPSSSSDSGSFNFGGFATFFTQNGNAGACGNFHSDSDMIAAIDQDRYGNSGETSPLCGKQVQIINTNNGKSVTVTIQDDCPTCANSNSIDLSVGAFTAIATEEEGMVPIKWVFL